MDNHNRKGLAAFFSLQTDILYVCDALSNQRQHKKGLTIYHETR